MYISQKKEMGYKKLSKTEKIWRKSFGWIGLIMFVAGTFKSFVSMFSLGQDVFKMGVFEIGFATCGFVLVLANRELGTLANLIGKKIVNKGE